MPPPSITFLGSQLCPLSLPLPPWLLSLPPWVPRWPCLVVLRKVLVQWAWWYFGSMTHPTALFPPASLWALVLSPAPNTISWWQRRKKGHLLLELNFLINSQFSDYVKLVSYHASFFKYFLLTCICYHKEHPFPPPLPQLYTTSLWICRVCKINRLFISKSTPPLDLVRAPGWVGAPWSG